MGPTQRTTFYNTCTLLRYFTLAQILTLIKQNYLVVSFIFLSLFDPSVCSTLVCTYSECALVAGKLSQQALVSIKKKT